MHDVRIEMTGPVGQGHVFIDDVEVHGVRKVSFTAEVNELNVVTLEVFAETLSVKGCADVTTAAAERRGASAWQRLRALFRGGS